MILLGGALLGCVQLSSECDLIFYSIETRLSTREREFCAHDTEINSLAVDWDTDLKALFCELPLQGTCLIGAQVSVPVK